MSQKKTYTKIENSECNKRCTLFEYKHHVLFKSSAIPGSVKCFCCCRFFNGIYTNQQGQLVECLILKGGE